MKSLVSGSTTHQPTRLKGHRTKHRPEDQEDDGLDAIFDFPEVKLRQVLSALLCTFILMVIGMVADSGSPELSYFVFPLFAVIFIFSLLAEWKFAYTQIRRLQLAANFPPLIGILAGGLLGCIQCGQGKWPTSFEITAYFITVWLVSEFYGWHLQKTFFQRLENLSSFLPSRVLRWNNKQKRFEKVPRKMIKIKDRILTEPFSRISFSGKILEGDSQVDARVITGDSTPVPIKKDDYVLAGSLNGRNPVESEVDSIALEFQLGQAVASLKKKKRPRGFHRVHQALCFLSILPVCVSSVFFIFGEINLSTCLHQTAMFGFLSNPRLFLLIIPAQLQRALIWSRRHEFFVFNPEVFEKLGRIRSVLFSRHDGLTTANYKFSYALRVAPTSVPILGLLKALLEKAGPQPLLHALRRWLQEEHVQAQSDVHVDHVSSTELKVIGKWNSHLIRFERINSPDANGIGFFLDDKLYSQFFFADTVSHLASKAIQLMERDLKLVLICSDLEQSGESLRRELESQVGSLNLAIQNYTSPEQKQNWVQFYPVPLYIGDTTEDREAMSNATVALAMTGSLNSSRGVADVYSLEPNLINVSKLIQFARSYRVRLLVITTFAVIYHLLAYQIIITSTNAFGLAAFLMPISSLLIYFFIIPLRPDLAPRLQTESTIN